jgi:hypothetical protein
MQVTLCGKCTVSVWLAEIGNVRHIDCDVVLLPDAALAAKAIAASRSLARLGSRFTLQPDATYAHLSLYMLRLRAEDITVASDRLAVISRSSALLQLDAIRYCQSTDYIDVEYARRKELEGLQRQIIASLNRLRDGLRKHDRSRLETVTGETLHNLQQYGHQYVGGLFRPHMTLTRFNQEQPQAEALLPPPAAFSGVFSRLGIFELGPDGTCARQLEVWELAAVPEASQASL